MSKGVKIRVDWYEFRTSLMLAAMVGAVFASIAFLAGIARGLPFPPSKWDDFTFALCAAFTIPVAWVLISQGVSDFLAALRKAREPKQVPQAPPTGRCAIADAASPPKPQPKRLAPPRRGRQR